MRGPSIVFCRHANMDETKIRPHIYGSEEKTCDSLVGFDVKFLFLYCAGKKIFCGKVECKD